MNSVQLAANDNRAFDLAVDFLLDIEHNPALTEDIAIAFLMHLAEDSLATKQQVASLEQEGAIAKVWLHFGKFRNSQKFQDLVCEFEPQELPKQAIVAVAGKKVEPQKPKATKAPKHVIKHTADDSDRQEKIREHLMIGYDESDPDMSGAFNWAIYWYVIEGDDCESGYIFSNQKEFTEIYKLGKKSNRNLWCHDGKMYKLVSISTIDKKYLPIKETKAPKQAKAAKAVPMPAIASLEQLQEMSDRKQIMQMVKDVKYNHKIDTRANAATVVLKGILAKYCLNAEYVEPAKAPKQAKAKKAAKVEPKLPMPENVTWNTLNAMKYRDLQAMGKVLRSNGLEIGSLRSKTEDLKSAIADALKLERTHTPLTKAQKKEIRTPMLDEVRAAQRAALSRQATELLKAAA